MRVHSRIRRRPTNSTLSPKTLMLIAAFSAFKESLGEPKPNRSWIIEQGTALFFDKMAKKFPVFRQISINVEAQFRKMEELARAKGGRGIVYSLAGRGRRH